MHWYVLYTKPKWERKVFEELQKRNIEAYCPVYTEVRQWSDRKKKISSPLFKSYVFVKLSEKERELVFEIAGVIRYLFWLGKPAIVREKELEVIREWLEDERTEKIEVSHLVPGDELVISGGSFKGKEAVISRIGKRRMKLVLKTLGIIVSVKLSDALEK